MTRRQPWMIVFAALLLVPVGQIAQGAGSAPYRVVDLGVLQQDTGAHVRGLNNAGALAGGGGSRLVAFVLTGSALEIIPGLPGGDWSVALGLNDDGVVVGASNTATALRAFIWSRAAGIRELSPLPGDSGSEALGVNRAQLAVGYSSGPAGVVAVVWLADGQVRRLPVPVGTRASRAVAISEAGDVVGTATTAAGVRALRWPMGGGVVQLGALPGDVESEVTATNNRGDAVGQSREPKRSQAVRWTPAGGIQALGTLPGGAYSLANGVNQRGDVVGTAAGAHGPRAFLWTAASGMLDVNGLIPAGADFVLTEGVGVNDQGVIAALGHDAIGGQAGGAHNHNLPVRAFLLVPTP
jgi:probable HAF family extracellular repeat protein